MAITARPKTRVVKIVRALNPDRDAPAAALIHERNRAGVRQFLSPETRADLGTDLFGYFEAQRIGNIWFVGVRIPHNLGW